MCILANDGDLKHTKIYVGSAAGRQLVVYGMTLDTLGENALILPVPANAEDVEMVDLSGSRDLFEKIEGHFPQIRSRGTYSFLSDIDVKEVGDFKVSVIPSKEDFGRVSPTLRVSRGTLDVLAEMYGPGYCYIVALLKEGGEVHPLGYTHPQANGRFHVPTLHYHKGENNPEWDHNIYINKRVNKSDVPLRAQGGQYGHTGVDYSERPFAVKALGIPEAIEPFFMGTATTRLRVTGSVTNMDLDL